MKKLTMTVKQRGLNLTREFKKNDAYKKRVALLRACCESDALSEWLGVTGLEQIADDPDALYVYPESLPWQLKIPLSRVCSYPAPPVDATFIGVFRQCAGLRYYEMQSADRTLKMPPPRVLRVKRPNKRFDDMDAEAQRGIADLILTIASDTTYFDREFFLDFQLDTTISNITETGEGQQAWTMSIGWTIKAMRDYHRDMLPIPTSSERPLLLASPTFRNAFYDLSQLWHHPNFKNFLLVAPPGSGKEELVEAFSAALGLERQSLVLGGKSGAEIEASLFGSAAHAGFLPKYTPPENDREKRDRAKKTAVSSPLIFFDEIDKCDSITRGALLRVVESRDFLDGRVGVIRKLNEDVRFCFAGSMPWDQMRKLEPVDFWTRVQHPVVMTNPLPANGQLRTLLRRYFLMFWGIRCAALRRHGTPNDYENELISRLEEWSSAKQIGGRFGALFAGPLVATPSVRILRELTERVFSEAYWRMQSEPDPDVIIKNLSTSKGMTDLLKRAWKIGAS